MSRLDLELVSRGMARSRTEAAKFITAGLVTSAGKTLNKASLPVDESTPLSVASSVESTYVSRAGLKLRGALDTFPQVRVRDKRCLDAGASTGGFTDVLLRDGASLVVATDVGHGQLVESIRKDPRVQVHEGLNARHMTPTDIGGPAQLTVADLSFISLTLVMSALGSCTAAGGDLLLMVKPQFEVGRDRLARTGVVSSETERKRAVVLVVQAALKAGLELHGLARSSLPGQDGNLEYFLWLRQRPEATSETELPKMPMEETGARAEVWVQENWPEAR